MREKSPEAEVFLARNSLISNIPGFLVADDDASLTFLTVHLITKLSHSSSYYWKFFRKKPCFNFMCRKPKTILTIQEGPWIQGLQDPPALRWCV
jgi:hypothetical protein